MASIFDRLRFSQKAERQLLASRGIMHGLPFEGKWRSEHFRNGKLLDVYEFYNDICNVGKNDLLTTYFYGGTQIPAANWAVGLISSVGYSALANTDTMASHPGWTEWTAYSQTNRVAWGQVAPVNQMITNTTAMVFDITSNGTVKGVFVVSNNSKAGTSGILWATALYSADVPVLTADQIRSTYTLSC